MRARLRLRLFLVWTLAAAVGGATQAAPLELAVKAAYLYKLAPYVSWPSPAFASPAAALHLCVAGTDPFGRVLDETVAGQQIDGRPIVLRRLDVIDRGSGCHVAYLGGSARQSVGDALRALRGGAVLTVTDIARDPRARGIVHFDVRAKRVRFHIDDRSAAEARLGISSKLLDLALTVQPRAR